MRRIIGVFALLCLAALLLFGFELKSDYRNFLWVNFLTQGLMALFSAGQALTNGVSQLFTLWFVPLALGCEPVLKKRTLCKQHPNSEPTCRT